MIEAEMRNVVARLGFANANGLGLTTILPLWVTHLGPELGASALTIGTIATAQILSCAIANLIARRFLKLLDPVSIAKIAMAMLAIGSLTQAAAPLPIFLAAAIIVGVASGGLLAATNAVAATSPEVQQSYSTYQLIEVSYAGSLLLISGFCLAHFGVRSVFICLGLAQFASLLNIWGLRPHHRTTSARSIERQSARGWLALTLLAICFAGQSSVNSRLLPIGERASLDADVIALVMSIGVFAGLIGGLAARLLGDRIGPIRPIAIGGACLAIDLVAVAHSHSPVAFMIGACLIPALTFFLIPYLFTLLASLDPDGGFAAIAPAFLLAGVAAGPLISAQVAQAQNDAAMGWIAAALTAASTMLYFLFFARSRHDSQGAASGERPGQALAHPAPSRS